MAIAVHSTILGPALGGARMWHYDDDADAVNDAKRLAGAMTLKAAAAGLQLGGGKGVIAAPPGPAPNGELRRALLLDFGDLVESLGGSYVTAEDVGTGADDMAVIAERTGHVVGLDPTRGGSGDPSSVTALGVLSAIRACVKDRYGSRELAGLRVCVVGMGHVGSHLAELLVVAGADLVVSDIDGAKRPAAERLGASWIPPEAVIASECDVLAPCALGGAIGAREAQFLRAPVVCGAANNVLTDDRLADVLDRRGVLYGPDFIANAGGLASVYGELRGLPPARARDHALGIEAVMGKVLARAVEEGETPLEAARGLALGRLGAENRQPERGLGAPDSSRATASARSVAQATVG